MPPPIKNDLPDEDSDRQFVTALARGLDVLRCFTADRPELGGSEIAEILGLPQPTVWRLCHTLRRLGYLVPAGHGKLHVGAAVLSLGVASLVELDFTQIIRPHLQQLANELPAAVILAEQNQLSMVYVLRCEGDTPFAMKRPLGSSISLFDTPLGRVSLCSMTAAERAPVLAKIRRQHGVDFAAVEDKLLESEEILTRQGFLTSLGEAHPAVNYAAVPVVAPDRKRFFTLLCGGPSFVLDAERVQNEIGPKLVGLARIVESAIPPSED